MFQQSVSPFKYVLVIFFSFCRIYPSDPSAVVGIWHGMLSDMQISLKKDSLDATIIKIYPQKNGEIQNYCTKGSCKDQPLVGMSVFKNFRWNKKKQRWEGEMLASGWNGKWYKTYLGITSKGQLKTTFSLGIFSYSFLWEKTIPASSSDT